MFFFLLKSRYWVLTAMDTHRVRVGSDSGNHLPYLAFSPRSVRRFCPRRPEQESRTWSNPSQHTRLQNDQICVLKISIDPISKCLICDFDVRDLVASQQCYRAICWRDPTPTCRVLCGTGDYLNLTESAAETLKLIIPRNDEDYFWIDQLCIKQMNFVERSAQVSMMGQIYSSAKQAILLFSFNITRICPLSEAAQRSCYRRENTTNLSSSS